MGNWLSIPNWFWGAPSWLWGPPSFLWGHPSFLWSLLWMLSTSLVESLSPIVLLPNYYLTNMRFNIDENSGSGGTTDHVTLLRLFFLSFFAYATFYAFYSLLHINSFPIYSFRWISFFHVPLASSMALSRSKDLTIQPSVHPTIHPSTYPSVAQSLKHESKSADKTRKPPQHPRPVKPENHPYSLNQPAKPTKVVVARARRW